MSRWMSADTGVDGVVGCRQHSASIVQTTLSMSTATRCATEDSVEFLHDRVGGLGPGGHGPATRGRDSLPGLLERGENGSGECLLVPERHEEPSDPVLDEFGVSTHVRG